MLVRLTAQYLCENTGYYPSIARRRLWCTSQFLASEKSSYLGFLETTIYSVLSIRKKLLLGTYQVINGLQIAFPSLILSLREKKADVILMKHTKRLTYMLKVILITVALYSPSAIFSPMFSPLDLRTCT